MEDSSPLSARFRVTFVFAVAALLLLSLLGLAAYRVVAGPSLSAADTAASLRSYTAGDPASYSCDRLWLDHWDYRCSFLGASGEVVVVHVRVDGRGIVDQTAP